MVSMGYSMLGGPGNWKLWSNVPGLSSQQMSWKPWMLTLMKAAALGFSWWPSIQNGPSCLMRFLFKLWNFVPSDVLFLPEKKRKGQKNENQCRNHLFGANGCWIWDSSRRKWIETLRGAVISIDARALLVIRHEVKMTKNFWKRPSFSGLGRGPNLKTGTSFQKTTNCDACCNIPWFWQRTVIDKEAPVTSL